MCRCNTVVVSKSQSECKRLTKVIVIHGSSAVAWGWRRWVAGAVSATAGVNARVMCRCVIGFEKTENSYEIQPGHLEHCWNPFFNTCELAVLDCKTFAVVQFQPAFSPRISIFTPHKLAPEARRAGCGRRTGIVEQEKRSCRSDAWLL